MSERELVMAINRHPVWDAKLDSDMAVVLAHFNPCDYRRPVENLLLTLDHLQNLGASVFLAYARFPGNSSAHALFSGSVPPSQVRVVETATVWFHKEPLWDKAVMELVPGRVENILLLDADVRFASTHPLPKISRRLCEAKAVHPYSFISYLDKGGAVMSRRMSVGQAIKERKPGATDPRLFQSGFAMALHRSFWRDVGGLYLAPVGGGDTLLCTALTGRWRSMRGELTAQSAGNWGRYEKWAQTTERWSEGRLDVADLDIEHSFHGAPQDRRYDERRDYIVGFDPETDVAFDENGLAGWSSTALDRKSAMIANVRDYFWQRREDA